MLNLIRHIPYLKQVAKHSVTAFGGPQMHFVRLHKLFVEERKDITNTELLELNAFVQLLPGASSSQLITLIGFKRGGVPLAFFTLLIWTLPACLLMGGLSFLVQYLNTQPGSLEIFRFVQPMAVGFLAYSALKSYYIAIKNQATFLIMLGAAIISAFIKSPWVFPVLIIIGSIITNFSDRRIPDVYENRKPIQWNKLGWFLLVFALAGLLSELARINQWEMRRPINLFENFYRFGSIVFGGGQVLIPMMFEQYVLRSKTKYLNADEFLTGAGMVQAFPGPVFSIAAFMGGMVLKEMGPAFQLLGCVIGAVAIFLPSFLLVMFFFPVWQILKKHVVFFRALEGINAVVVGIMWGGIVLLTRNAPVLLEWQNILVILGTFIILQIDKIPSPIIVLVCLCLGWWFS